MVHIGMACFLIRQLFLEISDKGTLHLSMQEIYRVPTHLCQSGKQGLVAKTAKSLSQSEQ